MPPDRREFAVRVSDDSEGQRVKASLRDVVGRLVEEHDNRGPGAAGEVWSLRLERATIGTIEDDIVLIEGLPPVLGWSRDARIVPAR